MMRELTVKVSDSQFDMLVNFLRTLPYVQLPTSLKRKDNKEPVIDKERVFDTNISSKTPFDLSSLGELDSSPFDIDDIKKNYSIKWENFHQVVELFRDVPLENYIEHHTELHTTK
jgi:hypothetical protein